jgi:electron-transferring-flavoprotein dehydrogenase
LKEHYGRYPDDPGGFDSWRATRDDILEEVYEISGASPKY